MTTIAVTGASGFIARHLISRLLENGHKVRGLSRNAFRAGIGSTASGFTFTPGDVRDASVVRSLIEGSQIVIHLAASFSPDDSITRIIVEGTERVLEACKDSKVERLVFLSCLGADAASHSPFYGAKWRAEALVRGSGVPHTILRPSLVVGRGDSVTQPLADLVKSWAAVPIPAYGEHRLQPIDVEDLAQCIFLATTEEEVLNESISVGGPAFITFRQLVDLVGGQLGVARPKVMIPLRLLPAVTALLPGPARQLYSGPRLDQLQTGVVASPGIVDRTFHFKPASVVQKLGSYLSPA